MNGSLPIINMIQYYLLISIACMYTACTGTTKDVETHSNDSSYQHIIAEGYEVYKPLEGGHTTLILFGGFPETASDIQREFDVLKLSEQYKINLVLMNYNRKLWLTESDKLYLRQGIESIFKQHQLPKHNIHIGGFSSGGNLSLLLVNHFIESQSGIQPKGVFAIDAPVDLLELYRLSERNIRRQFSKNIVAEAEWLKNMLQTSLGRPDNSIKQYEKYAVYTHETNNCDNLRALNGLKIRFYAEPDSIWWKKHRNNDRKDLNAFWIEQLSKALATKLEDATIEYTKTEHKGYRSDGQRHPHSWSIVDQKDLVEWIENE